MAVPNLLGLDAFDSDSDEEEILKQYDAYIVDLALKKVPRSLVGPESLHDEIDELAQKVRFKLLLTLRQKHIKNLKAYIKCIVYTEVVDMVRRYHSTFHLTLDEDGELYQGNVLVTQSEGTRDPAFEVEQKEVLDDYMEETFEAVLKLPPCQQRAMICSLKDQLDDLLPIIDAFRKHKINIEEVNWPEEKDELESLRTSLSVARKKLRSLKSKSL